MFETRETMRCCIETGFHLYYVFNLILRDFGLDNSRLAGQSEFLTPSQPIEPIEARHNTFPSDERAWGYALTWDVLCATVALV